jgi:hypothetical protein
MDVLMKRDEQHPKNPIIQADFAGPDSQYSHGLSVFFPWSRPREDNAVMRTSDGKAEYEHYKFNETEWFDFLKQYWGPRHSNVNRSIAASTIRGPARDEGDLRVHYVPVDELQEDITTLMFNPEGPLSGGDSLAKIGPRDPTGDECTCGTVKNFMRDTRTRRRRENKADSEPAFPISQSMPF